MVPACLAARLSLRSIFHGKGYFTDGQLDKLDGAGVVHFGGHGHPDRIDDGLTSSQLPRLARPLPRLQRRLLHGSNRPLV